MNRMEEYEKLMAELRDVPAAAAGTVARARARKNRSRIIWKPLASLAAVFAIFVGLVNLCPPVAAACREIPFLEQLVEAVSFSPSLTKAVENEYAQKVEQEQTKNGITARVEYLIVDQKQVNIFYVLDSDVYGDLGDTTKLTYADGSFIPSCGWSTGSFNKKNGDLRHANVDFMEGNVPEELLFTLKVNSNDLTEREPVSDIDDPGEFTEPDYIAEFAFLLRFDPTFTEQGRTVVLNKTVDLDGNQITIEQMEIYPSHIRLNIREEGDNPDWIEGLRFYLELEDGTRIQPITNGISATGTLEDPSVTSYRAESSYFYDAEVFKLVVTGAKLLDKENQWFHVDLEQGTTDLLPPLVEFVEAEHTQWGWKVVFRTPENENGHQNAVGSSYRDEDGNEYHCWRTAYTMEFEDGPENDGWDYETHYLDDYDQSEVWMELDYDAVWTPETPVSVDIRP